MAGKAFTTRASWRETSASPWDRRSRAPAKAAGEAVSEVSHEINDTLNQDVVYVVKARDVQDGDRARQGDREGRRRRPVSDHRRRKAGGRRRQGRGFRGRGRRKGGGRDRLRCSPCGRRHHQDRQQAGNDGRSRHEETETAQKLTDAGKAEQKPATRGPRSSSSSRTRSPRSSSSRTRWSARISRPRMCPATMARNAPQLPQELPPSVVAPSASVRTAGASPSMV